MSCCYLCDDCQDELDEAIAYSEAMAVSGAIQNIDRDKMAGVLLRVLAKLDDNGSLRSDSTALADAVLAALPELMKGEQA